MILSFWSGTIEYQIKTKGICAINLLAKMDIQYTDLKKNEDCTYTFKIPSYHKKKLNCALDGISAEYEIVNTQGLPKILSLYRRRWGILASILVFSAALIISGQFIWKVDIKGNDVVPDKVIIETLRELGCGVGTRIKDIKFDTLHNEFLIACKDIAWISVNVDGTHANVEVKETARAKIADKGYYNVVAAEDGQIEQVSAFEGKPQVKIGDTVRAGELLLSGVIDYRENQIRYESAEGEVYARVNRSFTVEVPVNHEAKIETGRQISKKKLKIFDFGINLFINSRIPYEKYDTINLEKQIVLFKTIELPVWIESEISREYTIESTRLTQDEARVVALTQFRSKLDETIGDAEVLSKTVRNSFENDVYKIECDLYCLANIAVKLPITIDYNTETEQR